MDAAQDFPTPCGKVAAGLADFAINSPEGHSLPSCRSANAANRECCCCLLFICIVCTPAGGRVHRLEHAAPGKRSPEADGRRGNPSSPDIGHRDAQVLRARSPGQARRKDLCELRRTLRGPHRTEVRTWRLAWECGCARDLAPHGVRCMTAAPWVHRSVILTAAVDLVHRRAYPSQ